MKCSDHETNLIVIESSWMNQFFSDSECILVIKLLNGLYDIFDIFYVPEEELFIALWG